MAVFGVSLPGFSVGLSECRPGPAGPDRALGFRGFGFGVLVHFSTEAIEDSEDSSHPAGKAS